jgi:hypothetical protein
MRPSHRQVALPELGFTVDEGLEELIRLCWWRGIATFVCCIGEKDFHDGDGYIGFFDPNAALRWEAVTSWPVEWNDDEEVATEAEVYFPRSAIPALVDLLRNVS